MTLQGSDYYCRGLFTNQAQYRQRVRETGMFLELLVHKLQQCAQPSVLATFERRGSALLSVATG